MITRLEHIGLFTLTNDLYSWEKRSRLLLPAAWGLLVISMLAYYIQIAAPAERWFYYNADHLYLAVLYADLTAGGELSGWRLTPSPYFFPDMALFFLLRALLGNDHLTLALYGVVQTLLFLLGLLLLGRRVAAPWTRRVHLHLVLVTALFFTTLPHLPPIFALLLSNAWHVGALVVIPYTLLLALLWLEEERHGRWRALWGILIFLMCALTVASDFLYVVQFIFPLLCVLLPLVLLRHLPVSRSLTLATLLLGAGAGGFILNKAVVTAPLPLLYLNLGIGYSLNAARAIESSIMGTLGSHPYLILLWLAFVGATLLVIKRAHEQPGGTSERRRILIASFLLALIVVNTTVGILTGNYESRYFLPILFFPTFFGWPFLLAPWSAGAGRIKRLANSGLLVSIVGLVLSHGTIQLPATSRLNHYLDYYPDFVACMDVETERRNLQNGIAQYWQAKPLSLLSRRDLHVVQALPDLSPYYWINNLDWYEREFEFLILDDRAPENMKFDPAAIIEKFGPPADTFTCEQSTIFVYNRPEDRAFQMVLQEHPTVQAGR